MTRSAEAARTRAAVFMTLGQFEMLKYAVQTVTPGETWVTISDESALALNAISGIVSHVELFVTVAVLDRAGRELGKLAPGAAAHLLNDLTREIENSWDGRLSVLQVLTNLSVKSTWNHWQAWTGLIAARNAWAHGRGELTRRQKEDKRIGHALKATGLSHRGDRVVASSDAVRRAVDMGNELVDILDRAVWNDKVPS